MSFSAGSVHLCWVCLFISDGLSICCYVSPSLSLVVCLSLSADLSISTQLILSLKLFQAQLWLGGSWSYSCPGMCSSAGCIQDGVALWLLLGLHLPLGPTWPQDKGRSPCPGLLQTHRVAGRTSGSPRPLRSTPLLWGQPESTQLPPQVWVPGDTIFQPLLPVVGVPLKPTVHLPSPFPFCTQAQLQAESWDRNRWGGGPHF